jgi:hypothetical protein
MRVPAAANRPARCYPTRCKAVFAARDTSGDLSLACCTNSRRASRAGNWRASYADAPSRRATGSLPVKALQALLQRSPRQELPSKPYFEEDCDAWRHDPPHVEWLVYPET